MADKNAKPRPVTVILPPEPPRLTPDAARALLRILVKAHERQVEEEEGRPNLSTDVELNLNPEEDELSP